jgi:hypothetical protein
LVIHLFNKSSSWREDSVPLKGKVTTPLRLIQLLDSTPNNSTFDHFNSDTFNFRSIQLMDNSTPRFFDTFNPAFTKSTNYKLQIHLGKSSKYYYKLLVPLANSKYILQTISGLIGVSKLLTSVFKYFQNTQISFQFPT